MKIDLGKYYILNPNNFYFSIDLQRRVKMDEEVVVKAVSTFQNRVFFGKLLDFGPTPFSTIYETCNEIEFDRHDVISEYHPDKLIVQLNYKKT